MNMNRSTHKIIFFVFFHMTSFSLSHAICLSEHFKNGRVTRFYVRNYFIANYSIQGKAAGEVCTTSAARLFVQRGKWSISSAETAAPRRAMLWLCAPHQLTSV